MYVELHRTCGSSSCFVVLAQCLHRRSPPRRVEERKRRESTASEKRKNMAPYRGKGIYNDCKVVYMHTHTHTQTNTRTYTHTYIYLYIYSLFSAASSNSLSLSFSLCKPYQPALDASFSSPCALASFLFTLIFCSISRILEGHAAAAAATTVRQVLPRRFD